MEKKWEIRLKELACRSHPKSLSMPRESTHFYFLLSMQLYHDQTTMQRLVFRVTRHNCWRCALHTGTRLQGMVGAKIHPAQLSKPGTLAPGETLGGSPFRTLHKVLYLLAAACPSSLPGCLPLRNWETFCRGHCWEHPSVRQWTGCLNNTDSSNPYTIQHCRL